MENGNLHQNRSINNSHVNMLVAPTKHGTIELVTLGIGHAEHVTQFTLHVRLQAKAEVIKFNFYFYDSGVITPDQFFLLFHLSNSLRTFYV